MRSRRLRGAHLRTDSIAAWGFSRASGFSRLAAQLGVGEGAVKMAVSRLRRRYRDLLRQEIAHTVTGPAEVEEEISDLFAALES